jgi:hypothetical protein
MNSTVRVIFDWFQTRESYYFERITLFNPQRETDIKEWTQLFISFSDTRRKSVERSGRCLRRSECFSFTRMEGALPSSVNYQIRCEKDGDDVRASFDLNASVGGPALIASFSLKAENKELIDQDQWVAGQTRFNGTQFTKLEDPDKNAAVTFSISSNEGWAAADSDILRRPEAL